MRFVVDNLDFDVGYGCDDQLSNSITMVDDKGLGAMVDQQHLKLSPVVLVDRSWRVENGYAMAHRKARAWSHLTLVSRW